MQRVAESATASLPARLLVPLVCAAFAAAATVTAQSPGTFSRTGEMAAARSLHSATLLSNGHVLIAGGGSDSVLDRAEIYDPVAGTFRAVGVMTTARRVHTATLLPDERVLIVGGYGGGGTALDSAELFDPATGTFTATGSLITARGGHTAMLLPTGMVLVLGGYGTRAYPNVAPAELYDPATGSFKAAGAYVGRSGCDFCAPAILLHDGSVLFPGQYPAQLYDPSTDSFSANGMMLFDQSTAAILRSGQVLFAGGEALGRLANAELYDPTSRTFARTGDMTSRRVWHTLTSLPDGLVLAAGGETDSCSGNSCVFAGSVASAELYDPGTGAFVPAGSMAFARSTHTATLLGDGRVLLAGGVSYGGIGIFHGSLASAELYTPARLLPAPAIVALPGDGRGQGAIFHAGTTHVAAPDDPATADAIVDVYCTGLTEKSAIVPRVVIGRRIAAVLSVSKAVDMDGATLLRVRVPRGIASAHAVSVRLIHLDRPSNEVTMAVQ
jgi:hypothetical protein